MLYYNIMTSMITNDISSGVSSMKQFITDNNIIGTCARVCVGLNALKYRS